MNGIVLQGPTKFFIEVSNFYSQFENVVFSTWETEPKNNLEYIKSKGLNLVISEPPKIAGNININYQLLSSFKGVEFLEKIGCTEIIKIRSDIIFYGVEKIQNILQGKDIAFLSLNKPYNNDVYFLDYIHPRFDFTTDHIIYGKTEILKSTFNFSYFESNNIPPESLILRNYLYKHGYKLDFSKENLKKSNVYIFAEDCLNAGCSIHWLKGNTDLLGFTFNPNENFITKL